MQLKLLSTVLLATFISGCGGGSSSDTSTAISSVTPPPASTVPPVLVPSASTTTDDPPAITINPTPPSNYVTISGKITYDLVSVDSDNIGLDYNNIVKTSAKGVQVVALDSSNQNIATAITDALGDYALALPPETQIKLRVYARLVNAPGTSTWDIEVRDNTNGDAYYVMDGSLASTGSTDSSRLLNAPSGWGGSSYTSSRVAAPFAILDNAYQSIQKVLSANPSTIFPPLRINWSVNNVSVSGNTDLGQITTSHYINSNLFILGDADSDTDEYDDHIITHEWGHYYEDKLSRSDSIGGPHGSGDILDIRVAFSEGFGNAFSGMVLDEPVYFDTMGASQADGFSFNMESESPDNPGWYSEASVQRILYDLYDDNSDISSDTLSFGFTPLHEIFTGAQKTTSAFTSIFSFITVLKDENIGDADDIDTLVLSENIAIIKDIYGNARSDTPYHDYLTLGTQLPIEISNADGTYNKLSNRQYVKFSIASSGTYTIKVQQTNGTTSDPDFYLFDTSPFTQVNFSEGVVPGLEQKDVFLSTGEYLLDISEYNNITNAQLNVSITLK